MSKGWSDLAAISDVTDPTPTAVDLARVLRQLRRREARQRKGSELTYRDLAAKTGWSVGIIGEYLNGNVLAPTDRFDVLIGLLGATRDEQGRLATLRDRVDESRRLESGERRTAAAAVPRQLPASVPGFVGRASDLAELDTLLLPNTAAVVICAISGTAGVGKTALAVHWAHRVAHRYPDGQLYVDLGGYGPTPAVSVGDALEGFLRCLGMPGGEIAGQLAERAAQYRTLLAGRRMLIVLDNASSAEQVRPLLPGTSSCGVVVTSRDDLAGLVAREGARRVNLNVLTESDAITLLRTLIGQRVDADFAAAVTLAEQCARLPLALRVAAELAAARPYLALAELTDDLRDAHSRLDRLDAGDARSAVRAVLSWSVQHLSTRTAHAFSLLGLHPGRDLDVYALAALTGSDLDGARQVAEELVRAHLVQRSGPSRLTMHDLLRAYAAQMASRHVDAGQSGAALTRLLDHYRYTAAVAAKALFVHAQDDIPALAQVATPTPPITADEGALSWLDSERSNLVAMSTYAVEHARSSHCVDLSRLLFWYLDTYAHYPQALTLHGNAVRACGKDCADRATVVTHLGIVLFRMGRLSEAIQRLHEALALSRARGDGESEARIHANLGLVCQRLGRHDVAGEHLLLALAHYRDKGDTLREAKQLLGLGLLNWRLGQYREAADHLTQAATGARAVGDRGLLGLALANLGDTYATLRRFPEALDHLAQALSLSRELNQRRLEGDTLGILGSVYRQLNRDADALEHLRQALAISRETGDRRLEIDTRNALGETLLSMGQPENAAIHHGWARDLADQTGDRLEQARALDGLAQVARSVGNIAQARQYGQRALAIYTELDVPAAARIREQLATPEIRQRTSTSDWTGAVPSATECGNTP